MAWAEEGSLIFIICRQTSKCVAKPIEGLQLIVCAHHLHVITVTRLPEQNRLKPNTYILSYLSTMLTESSREQEQVSAKKHIMS